MKPQELFERGVILINVLGELHFPVHPKENWDNHSNFKAKKTEDEDYVNEENKTADGMGNNMTAKGAEADSNSHT